MWHRKAHKTTLGINELVRRAFLEPGVYWFVAPYYNQAKKIVWEDPGMLQRYVPPFIWKKRNNSEQTLKFPNGSLLYVLGADKPDSLRGPNPIGIVLDEYDDMKIEIWQAIILPVVTANQNAWCWFTGTPKGPRDLDRKLQYALENPLWYGSKLTVEDTGLISKEDLEEASKSTTQAYFEQEFYCKIIEGAGQFFKRVDYNLWDGHLIPDKRRRYQIGVDLAKYNDWSVLTPFDLTTFKAGIQERFNQIDYVLQKAKIEAMYLRYLKGKVWLDSTGIGEPIYDDLVQQRIQNIEPFTFTEKSRTDLLRNLQILLEQDKIKIPDDEILKTELRNVQYQLGERGKVKIGVQENQHDDCVMSLALSTWGIPNETIPMFDPEQKQIVRQFDSQTKFGGKKYFTGSRYLR